MGDVTRRFRASSGIPYVRALTAVLEYARGHLEADFTVGHIAGNVTAFVHNGMTVSGPEPVVDALTDLIEREGLTEVEALWQRTGTRSSEPTSPRGARPSPR